MNLFGLPRTEEDAIKFLQEKGILPMHRTCQNNHEMKLYIDESMFTKRKNNAGRILPQQWIFGGICRETKDCFLVQLPDRKAKTLLHCIKENIAEGSIIYSDCWKGYKTAELEEAGFEHFTVNHEYNFVDPDTGVNTQKVERMWGSAKWRNKKQRGTKRDMLQCVK